MQRLHLLLIFVNAFLWAESPAQWERVNPRPTNVQLNGICLTDSLNIWAVGSRGIVVHSTDGGRSWSEHLLLPRGELQKIVFTSPSHGVIVGGDDGAQNGALFVTTDGGKTWVDKHPNTQYRYAYFDVYFFSPARGWIAGFEGIFSTTDGGQSWQRSTSSGLGWNTSVFFNDSLDGWCTNPTGGIMRSTDGGITWSRQASLGWRWFKRIRFATPSSGWAIGGGLYETKAIIFRTTDGGTSWTLQDSLQGHTYFDIHVLDSLRAWVVGDRGTVRYTTDGGGIWYTAWTNNTDSYVDVTFHGSRCWIVGGSYSYPVILTADNGANPRVTKSSHFTLANLTGMQFTSDTTGWLSADDGTLFRSTNGGADWQPLNLFSVPWRSMSAPDSKTLFVGGDGGTLLRTADGGQTWMLSAVSGVYSIIQMKFVNSRVGWILGGEYYGALLRTNDGGATWSPLNAAGIRFELVDEQNGWLISPYIIGGASQEPTRLLHTTDGGTTWSFQTLYSEIHDITFRSAELGWMTVGFDSVMHTTDGGTTWQFLCRLGEVPNDIRFVTDHEGWVRGIQHVFHTTDGGTTFTPEEGALSQTQDAMYFYSRTLGFVFGTNGGLLRYSNPTVDVHGEPPTAGLPTDFELSQNFPNPFNGISNFEIRLPAITELDRQTGISNFAQVSLKIYDILGREVVTLVNEPLRPGTYQIRWNGKNARGVDAASGLYLYRLEAGSFSISRKMLLVR